MYRFIFMSNVLLYAFRFSCHLIFCRLLNIFDRYRYISAYSRCLHQEKFKSDNYQHTITLDLYYFNDIQQFQYNDVILIHSKV